MNRLLSKLAMDYDRIKEMAEPTLFNKIERLVTPRVGEKSYDEDDLGRGIRRERYAIQKRFGINPTLAGSMHNRLNLPDSVDVDFFADVQDRDKYERVIAALNESGDFKSSPFNKPGSGYAVYTRKDPGTSGQPVDLAVAYGDPASDYRKSIVKLKRGVTGLDPELKQKLLDKKQLLRDTPFFSKSRYRKFKRHMREAMDVPTLKREELDKAASVVDLSDQEALERFKRFIKRKDLVGHRTTAGEDVVRSGKIMSSKELHRKGLLYLTTPQPMRTLRLQFRLFQQQTRASSDGLF